MKKLSLVLGLSLGLILLLGAVAMADNTIKIGADFSGQLNINNPASDSYTTNTGYAIGYEFTIPQGQLEYGGGVEYQFDRSVQGNSSSTLTDGSQFGYIPVYGLINYSFTDGKDFQPYVTARLGYDFMNGDSNFTQNVTSLGGGLYYAAGFGVNYQQYKAEILYASCQGSGSIGGSSYNLTDNSWQIRAGYKF